MVVIWLGCRKRVNPGRIGPRRTATAFQRASGPADFGRPQDDVGNDRP